ncbi:MAG: PhzF family phenazine biosynthesis protein [Pseudomonadota bacterium]|nr:PhzF family phenazine biosynthesis protein [Pseudomonadota bacterium]
MSRRFHTLDVFADKALEGNPLAVVLDSEGLDGKRMQAIAGEFNLSETVFVMPPANPAHSAKIRIFTPSNELPFAGHPTVGTAILLATLKSNGKGSADDAIVVLEEAVGPVRCGVKLKPGKAPFAEFDAPRVAEPAGDPAPLDRLAAALCLAPNEIGFENHKPTRFTAGVPYTFVPVRDLKAMARADVARQYWQEAFGHDAHAAAFLYCRETVQANSDFHGRMFAPQVIAKEDPATGSAVAAFTGVALKFDAPPDGLNKWIIEQGFEMGRPSIIYLEAETKGGKLRTTRIGGHAVLLQSGTIDL